MLYARIEKVENQNGVEWVVRETLETDDDITRMFHRSLVWVSCPAGTAEGDVYMDGAVLAKNDYRVQRARAYPKIGDQLDALWKAVDALAAGQPVPADATAVKAAIASVKAAHPKA